jgi:hypothetical protein
MYTIAYDSKDRIIRMSVAGFWSTQTVDALFAELIPLLAKAKATGHPVLVLSDAREFPIQTAEVGEAFARADLEAAKLRDRMAVVVGSTLGKLQARRFTGPKLDFFSTFEEAERWLWAGVEGTELPAKS